MPSSAPSTSTRALFSVFGHSAVRRSEEVDIEAQPPMPVAAAQPPRASRLHSTHASSDAIDNFFGASHRAPSPTLLTGTRDSRHDEVHPPTPVDDADALPSYEHATGSTEPPAYTPVSDQPTLAMYLFKFGFCEYLPCSRSPS